MAQDLFLVLCLCLEVDTLMVNEAVASADLLASGGPLWILFQSES